MTVANNSHVARTRRELSRGDSMFSGKKIVFLDKRHPLSLLIMFMSSVALLGKALYTFLSSLQSKQLVFLCSGIKVQSLSSHLEKTTSSRFLESIYLLLKVIERM